MEFKSAISKIILSLSLPLLLLATPAFAQLVTSDLAGGTVSADDLAQSLAGPGVTISNVTFTGANVAAGSFSGGDGIIGFSDGIILSSGSIGNVVGPNVNDAITTDNLQPEDADLTSLAGFPTSDAAILEFDFVPQGDTVSFLYVFSSDEYNEFVETEFNDVFAFYVNGTNCAVVGAGPVSINTINNGNPFGVGTATHPELYINNDVDDGGPSLNTEMDGLTTVLTCQATVTPGTTNHMKLAIADASDGIYDSNVFIQAGSLSACEGNDCGQPAASGAGGLTELSGSGCFLNNQGPVSPGSFSMLMLALGLPLAVFLYRRARA